LARRVGRFLTNNVHGAAMALELLRFEIEKLKPLLESLKPCFRFCSILLKNRGFGADFDNRNNTTYFFIVWSVICHIFAPCLNHVMGLADLHLQGPLTHFVKWGLLNPNGKGDLGG